MVTQTGEEKVLAVLAAKEAQRLRREEERREKERLEKLDFLTDNFASSFVTQVKEQFPLTKKDLSKFGDEEYKYLARRMFRETNPVHKISALFAYAWELYAMKMMYYFNGKKDRAAAAGFVGALAVPFLLGVVSPAVGVLALLAEGASLVIPCSHASGCEKCDYLFSLLMNRKLLGHQHFPTDKVKKLLK